MLGEYYVEEILGKKKFNGVKYYLVKWDGYSIDQATWEPIENLENCKKLVKKFEADAKKNERDKKIGIIKKITGLTKSPNGGNTLENKDEVGEIHQQLNEFSSKEVKEYEVLDQLGSRIPTKILNVKRIDGVLYCLCNYETKSGRKRKDLDNPQTKYISASIMKDLYPKLYIEFLESRIKFVYKKQIRHKEELKL